MKLLRFELKDDPELIRSGIVQGGRIYETQDGVGVAMHEPSDVRPLMPIAQANSVRFFDTRWQPSGIEGAADPDLSYYYGNPGALIAPSQVLDYPLRYSDVGVTAAIGAVLLSDAFRIEPHQADGLILGYTLVLSVVSPSQIEADRRANRPIGFGTDLASAFGPVITTPEELADFVAKEDYGIGYQLSATVRINGVEVATGDTMDFPFTFAQAIALASQASPVRAGDVFVIGPVVDTSAIRLDPGDEAQLAVESLGALSLKMGI
jgi:2-keto-4-pentenoate hydratase/2-oxohepta-3-ene-1,7-dioic acid hydratase in catechol pathway